MALMMSPHNSILFPRTPRHDCQLSFSTTNFLCCTPTGKPIIISSRLRLSAEAPTLNAIHGYGFHVKCCCALQEGEEGQGGVRILFFIIVIIVVSCRDDLCHRPTVPVGFRPEWETTSVTDPGSESFR